jgi:hypothetical protein
MTRQKFFPHRRSRRLPLACSAELGKERKRPRLSAPPAPRIPRARDREKRPKQTRWRMRRHLEKESERIGKREKKEGTREKNRKEKKHKTRWISVSCPVHTTDVPTNLYHRKHKMLGESGVLMRAYVLLRKLSTTVSSSEGRTGKEAKQTYPYTFHDATLLAIANFPFFQFYISFPFSKAIANNSNIMAYPLRKLMKFTMNRYSYFLLETS